MTPWIACSLAAYLIVAAALLFIMLPYSGEISRKHIIRDAALWPIWFLIVIVEAAEEARRSIAKDRVE